METGCTVRISAGLLTVKMGKGKEDPSGTQAVRRRIRLSGRRTLFMLISLPPAACLSGGGRGMGWIFT